MTRGMSLLMGLCLLSVAALLVLSVADWQLGPEFLPFAPLLLLLGLLFLRAAMRVRGRIHG